MEMCLGKGLFTRRKGKLAKLSYSVCLFTLGIFLPHPSFTRSNERGLFVNPNIVTIKVGQ